MVPDCLAIYEFCSLGVLGPDCFAIHVFCWLAVLVPDYLAIHIFCWLAVLVPDYLAIHVFCWLAVLVPDNLPIYKLCWLVFLGPDYLSIHIFCWLAILGPDYLASWPSSEFILNWRLIVCGADHHGDRIYAWLIHRVAGCIATSLTCCLPYPITSLVAEYFDGSASWCFSAWCPG